MRYVDAARNYYARNIADYRRHGLDWDMFGMPCTIVEAYDDQGRSYFMAQAAFRPAAPRLLTFEDWLAHFEGEFDTCVGDGKTEIEPGPALDYLHLLDPP